MVFSPFYRGFMLVLAVMPFSAAAQPVEDARPLSPAQVALFMTPHMKNVEQPETLQYHFTRSGQNGFEDTVSERIITVHPDGTKAVSFDFLNGEHHKVFPGVDDFAGNPLLMLFLENDVQTMKDTLGVSAVYFRNRVRSAMVDKATISDITYTFAGQSVVGREVTVSPFTDDQRLEKLPSVQAKIYRFVLSDAVPGGIATIQTSMPADPARGIEASGEKLEFAKVVP